MEQWRPVRRERKVWCSRSTTSMSCFPKKTLRTSSGPNRLSPDSPGQHEEWLIACKTGSATGSPFDTYSGPLTEANHLGNVAFRAGGKIEWDSKNLRVTNNEAANQFLTRTPRAGWNLS